VLCLLALLDTAGASDGHFRFAAMSWARVHDNVVDVVVDSEWRRSYTGLANSGFGSSSAPKIGDKVYVNGADVPTINFGDGTSSFLEVTVTQYSNKGDWFRGQTRVRHTYSTPNNAGSPWVLTFTGCCRINGLVANSNSPWQLTSSIDLTASQGTPRPSLLSMLTVAQNDTVRMSLDGPSPSCPLRASTNSAASILSDSDMGVVNATNIGQAATANGSSIVVNGTTLQTGIHVLAAKVGGSPVELLVRVIQPPTIISGSVVGNRIPSVTCTPWVQGNLPHPDDTQGLHYAFAGSPICIHVQSFYQPRFDV